MNNKYNPRLSSHEELKNSFVGRDEIFKDLLDDIRLFEGKSVKQHWMFYGPRGIGKSHLLTLAYHEVREDKELSKIWIPALLPEEIRLVSDLSSFLEKVLREIIKELEASADGKESALKLEEAVKTVKGSLKGKEKSSDRARSYFAIIDEIFSDGRKRILLLAENMQGIIGRRMSVDEQKHLRSFLQTSDALMLVGTATTVFKELTDHSLPFYNFFRLERLEELSQSDMKKLVFNAIDRHGRMEEKDKAALAPKLNAAHALTGGNPRMAAFMADIVCCENVEPMLDFMMKLIDEITPYYDAVFKDVPEHQRNILDVLAEYEPAQSPADIASKLETGSEVIRNYLIPLKDNGYVRLAFSDGRSNYYCLNEYLYRIFRQTRGGHPRDRDRWVIEWLFLLYSFDEISAMRDNVSQGVVRVRDTNVMKKLLSEAVEYRKANPVDCDNIEMIKRMAAGTSDKAEKTEPTMTLVIEHIKKKEFEQALEEMLIMEQEDENHTNNAMFNYVRATCLFCLGRHQEAIESFELAAGQDSDAHRIFSGWGSNLIALNRYEEAIEKFEIAARINPEDHSIYSGWGHSLVALKKYKEAAEKFETAARLNSDDYMTYSGWGHSLKVLNMNEEAIEKFEIAARLNPGDYLSYSGWGHSLAALNRHEEAIEKFETTARLNPDDYMTYSSWGRSLMALNRHEEASDKFEIAARINPKDFLIYTGWGRSLMALNRNIEAMEKFETAARLNPDEYLIYLVWGNSLAALIKHKEAMEKFETAARLNSDEYLIYLVWGNSLAALIRHEEAVEKFENAARLNSDDYMTYSGWGHSLAALNRHEEAIEKFETTARLNPDDYMTYSSWGRSLMALNRHEEAAGKFEIAEKLNSDFNNFTDLALCQIQMERYDEATLSLIRAYNLETRITISGMLEETAAKLNPEEYIRMFYSKVEGERFTDEELCALLAATDRFEAATDCLANLREKYLVKKENNKKDLTLLTGLLKMQLFTKLARGKGAEALRVVDLIVAALKYYGENNKDDKNEKEEEIRLITFRVILLHAAGKSTEKDSVNVIARFKEARNDGLPWSESLEIVFKCITEPKTLEAKKAMADKAIRAIVKIIRKQAKELEFAEI